MSSWIPDQPDMAASWGRLEGGGGVAGDGGEARVFIREGGIDRPRRRRLPISGVDYVSRSPFLGDLSVFPKLWVRNVVDFFLLLIFFIEIFRKIICNFKYYPLSRSSGVDL